jgi:hypothetical protein
MHDYFDIVGVPRSAQAMEARQRSAAYVRRWHPDFGHSGRLFGDVVDARRDVAVEFVPVTAFLDRIQAQFFASPRG